MKPREIDVAEAILQRRSVRAGFSDRPIPRGTLDAVCRCGLAAPSAKGARPWRLHVVASRRLLDDIAGAMETSPGIDEYAPSDPATGEPKSGLVSTVLASAEILRGVPAAVFIETAGTLGHARRALLAATPEGREASLIGYTFEVMGLGAAMENMWLAAEAFGLSAVYLGDVIIAERFLEQHLLVSGELAGALALGFSEHRGPQKQSRHLDEECVVWHS